MAVTPPPPTRLHTPPAPVHGPKYDKYEPFRSKTRPQRHRPARTPSPTRRPNIDDSGSPKRTSARIASLMVSPPPSVRSTPHHPTNGKMGHLKRDRDGQLLAQESDDFEVLTPSAGRKFIAPEGLLPTPVKTPRKRDEKYIAGAEQAARVLVLSRPETVEEMMPSPKRRKTKKHLGFTLDSFEERSKTDEQGEEIQIFTDWKDREPETKPAVKQGFTRGVEKLHDPFVDGNDKDLEAEKQSLSKNRKKKSRMATMPDGSEQPISELVGRDDGLLKDFRGKTFFQPFSEDHRNTYQPVSLWPGKLRSQRVRTRAHSETDDEVDGDTSNPEEQITDIDEDQIEEKRRPELKRTSSTASANSPFSSWPRTKPGNGTRSRKVAH
ncbi:MAG: hypothetical protein M1814_001613 [Vezdaea aestivalis]|nr:MAG: hypothetical protein M1814_001613 [Vezdaea aestivalis]